MTVDDILHYHRVSKRFRELCGTIWTDVYDTRGTRKLPKITCSVCGKDFPSYGKSEKICKTCVRERRQRRMK